MPLASIPSPPHARVHLGPVTLRWQALAIVAGILLAIWLADRRYRAAGGPRGAMTDVAAWAVPAGLIPAAIGALTAQAHGGWQTVRTWDAVLGFPGALALGILGAWLACRRLRAGQPQKTPGTPGAQASASAGARVAARPVVTIAPVITAAPIATLVKGGRRLRFGPVAAAAAPAIAFGLAVAALGNWFSQQDFGHPSSLPWAVAIAPAHRPAGYENFATFQPLFLYQALWAAAAGVGVAVATAGCRCAATARSRCTPPPTRPAVSRCFGWVSDTYRLSLASGRASSATPRYLSAQPFTWSALGPRATRLTSLRTSRPWKAIHQSCNVNVTYV